MKRHFGVSELKRWGVTRRFGGEDGSFSHWRSEAREKQGVGLERAFRGSHYMPAVRLSIGRAGKGRVAKAVSYCSAAS